MSNTDYTDFYLDLGQPSRPQAPTRCESPDRYLDKFLVPGDLTVATSTPTSPRLYRSDIPYADLLDGLHDPRYIFPSLPTPFETPSPSGLSLSDFSEASAFDSLEDIDHPRADVQPQHVTATPVAPWELPSSVQEIQAGYEGAILTEPRVQKSQTNDGSESPQKVLKKRMEEYLLTTDCTDSVSSELSLPTVPSPESQDALGLTVPSDWRAPSGKENYCSTAGQQGDGFSSHPFPSCAPCTSAALPIGQPTGFEQPRHDHAELAGLSILGLLPPFTPYAAPETNDPISHFLSFPSSGYLQSYPLACSEAVGPSSTAAIPPELTPCQDNSGSGNCSLHAGEVPPTSEKPSFPITAAPPEMRTSTKRRRADDEEVAVAGPSGTAAQAPAAGPTVWTRDVEPESTAAPPAKRFRRTKEQVKQYTQDLPLVPCPVTGCGTLFCPTQRHKTSAHLKIHYGAQALKGTEELACLWGCRESIRGKAILSHVCDEHVGKPFMCPLKLELRCEWSSSRSGYQRQHMLLVHGVPDWKP